MLYGGLDIGGTKCAALIGRVEGGSFTVVAREAFPTPEGPDAAIARMISLLEELAARAEEPMAAIGVSCGGPLSSKEGLILSPPNLPGWDRVPIRDILRDRFSVPVALQNDANACALAEWRFGAGRGCRNMIFLTFGTGMGAGLVLDGKLYAGTNDMAGEEGHMRLAPLGPVGFGKSGSFEGFCSGGGLARFARIRATEALQMGHPFAFCPTTEALEKVSARTVAEAAHAGDADARAIYRECGEWLGRGLAVLADVLNPERIVIGSVFARSEDLLRESCMATLQAEALPHTFSVLSVVPAQLGDSIGDAAALSVAVAAAEGTL